MRIPGDLQSILDRSGAVTTESREIPHGSQYRLSRGPEEATLNVYRTGKVSVGGKQSGLRELLEGWKRGGSTLPGKPRRGSGSPELDLTPRVGTDEAGKGEYFGPLVVAGVRVLGEAARGLQRIGVRDSKALGTAQATALSREILSEVGPENVCVVSLSPREYDRRRTAAGSNVNKLLGELNVEIIDKLQGEVEVFVVDEFGRSARSYIEPWMPEGVRLEVRPRAEDDAAVAAASILARARYLADLAEASREVGFELPRGSTHVHGAARRVYRERGFEGLAGVAKVSFATTGKVLGSAGSTG